MNATQQRWLTENTHPSHDFHPDDDVIACDLCGCRTYNDEAKQPCVKGPSRFKIGDRFYTDGELWEVVGQPFRETSAEGEQWWYPSWKIHQRNIKESNTRGVSE